MHKEYSYYICWTIALSIKLLPIGKFPQLNHCLALQFRNVTDIDKVRRFKMYSTKSMEKVANRNNYIFNYSFQLSISNHLKYVFNVDKTSFHCRILNLRNSDFFFHVYSNINIFHGAILKRLKSTSQIPF